MNKLIVFMLACAFTVAVNAADDTQGAWVGRDVVAFTNSVATVRPWARGYPVQVAQVTVAYATPTNNTITVTSTLSGTRVTRFVSDAFTNTTSITCTPAALWLKPEDTLTVSNAVPAASVLIIDYTM